MAIRIWVAPADGVWSDSNNWAESLSIGAPASPPGPGDTAFFTHLGSYYKCTLDQDVEIRSLFCTPQFWGTIDFDGYDLTATFVQLQSAYIQLLGMSGTTWTNPTANASAFSIGVAGQSLRDLKMASIWTIDGYLSSSIEDTKFAAPAEIENVDCSGCTGLMGAAGCSDIGGNLNIYFGPTDPSSPGVVTPYGEARATSNNPAAFSVSSPPPIVMYVGGIAQATSDTRIGVRSIRVWPENADEETIQTRSDIDWTNQSDVLFTIATTPVDLSDTFYNLESLEVSYQGKTLSFTEIGTPTYGRRSWDMGQAVSLQMDLGSGLKTWFTGVIKTIEHIGRTGAEGIKYTALGTQGYADECSVAGDQALPYFMWGSSTAVNSALSEVFSANGILLGAHSLPSTIGAPGLDSFGDTPLPTNFNTQNAGFTSSLQQILAATDPTKKVFFDDVTGTWTFPDLYAGNFVNIVLGTNQSHTTEHLYKLDSNNRAGSVTVTSEYDGSIPFDVRKVIELEEDWEEELEADWTIRRALGLDGAAALGDAYSYVYRRWKFSEGALKPFKNIPEQLFVQLLYCGIPVWIPIKAAIDWRNSKILAWVPQIAAGNPHMPGDAIGALAAVLTYYEMVTMPIQGQSSYTYPESGTTGNAGSDCNKQITADPAQLTEDYAQAQLQPFQDIIVDGTITIAGDPIELFINLQKQIIVTHPERETGFENVYALLMGYTYTFGKVGTNTLRFSTDVTQAYKK